MSYAMTRDECRPAYLFSDKRFKHELWKKFHISHACSLTYMCTATHNTYTGMAHIEQQVK